MLRFISIFKGAKPIEEFEIDLFYKTLEKFTVCEGRKIVVKKIVYFDLGAHSSYHNNYVNDMNCQARDLSALAFFVFSRYFERKYRKDVEFKYQENQQK